MYLTQSNNVRNLKHDDYFVLQEMCKYANNLYNVALYNIRQYYFQEKKFLRYEENYKLCKMNENYKMLQAGVSQQILKVVDRSFKSFFNLINKARNNEYRFQDIHIPHYKEKGGMFNLILSTNAINIQDGYLRIPSSYAFREKYGNREIKIPTNISNNIKEIRIMPHYKGKYFTIQYCYEKEKEELELSKNNTLAIDIGLNNLATCVTNTGTSFIIDGRKVKSINQYWNMRMKYYDKLNEKQNNDFVTERMFRLTKKRNNKINDYMKKSARYIVNYCIKNNIGTIVCGYNPDFKRNTGFNQINNRQFNYISFGNLREQLSNLCDRYGLEYIEQEESYTSKASFIDLDEIPVYNPFDETEYKFSGSRVKRGLYKTKNKQRINADVNGACNILRKSKRNFEYEELCKRLLASPLRIRLI